MTRWNVNIHMYQFIKWIRINSSHFMRNFIWMWYIFKENPFASTRKPNLRQWKFSLDLSLYNFASTTATKTKRKMSKWGRCKKITKSSFGCHVWRKKTPPNEKWIHKNVCSRKIWNLRFSRLHDDDFHCAQRLNRLELLFSIFHFSQFETAGFGNRTLSVPVKSF